MQKQIMAMLIAYCLESVQIPSLYMATILHCRILVALLIKDMPLVSNYKYLSYSDLQKQLAINWNNSFTAVNYFSYKLLFMYIPPSFF